MAFRARRFGSLWDALLSERVAEAVQVIQRGDINVNQSNEGKTPMQALSENPKLSKPELFEALLAAGSAIDDTCLYRACFVRNVHAVRLLLDAKRAGRAHFNVNIIHPARRNTPLFVAVEHQTPAICSLLLNDPDVDPNIIVNNMTALYYAVIENLFDIVDILLQNPRTDPNLAYEGGTTPLHIAVFKNHIRCVRLLLANPRIDTLRRDTFDMTALDIAKFRGYADNIVLLLEAIPAPAPAPALATALRIHQFDEVPRIIDYLSMEETPYTDYDDTYMIFKFGDMYFARSKESIRKHIYDAYDPPPPEDEEDTRGDHIVFECMGEQHGAPTQEQIHTDHKLFILSGNGNYIVPLEHILGALVHPTNTFEITGPVRQLNFITSYSSVIVKGARGYQRRPVDITSRDHCQAGTEKQLYELHPLQLEPAAAAAAPAAAAEAEPGAPAPRRGGGRRRTATARRHYRSRRPSRRHRKN